MSIDWKPLWDIIQNNQRFVLTSHIRPDADALGSELAMANLLEDLGKQVMIANPAESPANLQFLIPENRIRSFRDGLRTNEIVDTDVHMILDTSAWTQLSEIGRAVKQTTAQKVVIDHHVSSDDLGAVEFKDTQAEATGVLVFQFARTLDLPISKTTAEYLFVAIATDTGWFRFSSTKADTYRTIAELIDAGAEPHVLYNQLYEQKSLARIQLASRIMGRVKLEFDRTLGYTTVAWNDFVECGAAPADTEDLVNECLTIAGTQCAFIAVEQQSRRIKVSFRSRSDVNVAAVAEQYGGGGHKQAAGAMLDGPLDVATKKVLATMKAALE